MKKIIILSLMFLVLSAGQVFAFHIVAGSNNEITTKNKLLTHFYLSTKNGKEFIGTISRSGRIILGFERITKQRNSNINGDWQNHYKRYDNGTYLASPRINIKYNIAKHKIIYLISNSTAKKRIFIYERKKLIIGKVTGGKLHGLNIPDKDLHFWYNSNFNTIYPSPEYGNYKTILIKARIFKNGEDIIFKAVDGLEYVFYTNRSGTYAGLYVRAKGKLVNIVKIWRDERFILFKLWALNKFHVDVPIEHFNIIKFGTLKYAIFNFKV